MTDEKNLLPKPESFSNKYKKKIVGDKKALRLTDSGFFSFLPIYKIMVHLEIVVPLIDKIW